MRNKSGNWFFLAAAALAASLSVSTIAAAAPPGIGMKVPGVRSAVLQVYEHNYGDYTVDGPHYWRSEYYGRRGSYHDWSDDYVWSPPRRRSCGEFYYWNGRCCVDARWHPPYVGPKW